MKASGDSTLASALAGAAVSLGQTGPSAWTAVLSNGAGIAARVDTGDGWLVLDAPAPESGDAPAGLRTWRWAEWNARLDGPVKITLPPLVVSSRLRVDVPIDDGMSGEEDRVRHACAALERAIDQLAGGHPRRHVLPPGGDAPDLRALCAEAGWAFVEREGSRVSLDLGIERRPVQAVLVARPSGVVTAAVELVRGKRPTPASRHAVARFLLAASAAVRLARGYVAEAGGDIAAGFVASSLNVPTAAEVGHLLSSLSVAASMFASEAVALTDDRTARAYLAMCAVSARVLETPGPQPEKLGCSPGA